ncbi:immunoglobulin-like domain-containing protein, partial [Desulfovibrio sp. Fe33]|uniref:immunoglobulin-like domain-containing protein n=1 Tax=Desulfovibrio sp. Fe33 TaxID=3020842 RepID=UPI00234D0551
MADQTTRALHISLPGAGEMQRYTLTSEFPIQFDFDLSSAEFVGKDGNLEIAVENGGTIVLENYQALAESNSLPSFATVSGEVVAGDVYLFAFENMDQTAEDMETAADAAASGSGAGTYSDDAGNLFDGLTALGGQGDAYDKAAFTEENTNIGLEATQISGKVTIGDVTVAEGGSVTITASVTNAPQSDLTLTLDNGETITIPAGATIGSVTFAVQGDDPYIDAEQYELSISGYTGGNYSDLDISDTATVTVSDTVDTTTVTLGDVSVDEGGNATITATVDNAPQTDLTLNLSNGETVTIAAGTTTGSATFAVQGDDPYVDGGSFTVGIDSATGGNYENLNTDDTAT